MGVLPSVSNNVRHSVTGGRNLQRRVCGSVLAGLVALLIPLLIHKSKQPWMFGLYSRTYLAVIFLHLAAIALAFQAFQRSAQEWPEAARLTGSSGFWFFFSMWILLTLASLGVYWITGDADARNLSFALVSGGVCAWWVVFRIAGRAHRVLTNLALACTVSLGTVVVAELILAVFPIVGSGTEMLRRQKIRLCQFERATRSGREWYQSTLMLDPVLGYRQRPNYLVAPEYGGTSGTIGLRTDSMGFFNNDYDSSHPCDVACVGDSFVAQPWPILLGQRTGLRVAGFAVPAYAPPQYTILVKDYALKLKPRVLLYCLYVNDGIESVGYEDWKKSGMDWFSFKGSAWFGFPSQHDGRLLVREYLLRCSRVYTLIDLAVARPRDDAMPIRAHSISYQTDKFSLVFDRASFTVMTDLKSDVIRRGMTIIRASLDEAARACRDANVTMIVLLLPPKELVHDEALKARVRPEDPVDNMREFYQALAAMSDSLHLKYYDVTDRFRAEAAKTGKALYNEVDIHWDGDGVDLIVEIVADILKSLGEFNGSQVRSSKL